MGEGWLFPCHPPTYTHCPEAWKMCQAWLSLRASEPGDPESLLASAATTPTGGSPLLPFLPRAPYLHLRPPCLRLGPGWLWPCPLSQLRPFGSSSFFPTHSGTKPIAFDHPKSLAFPSGARALPLSMRALGAGPGTFSVPPWVRLAVPGGRCGVRPWCRSWVV